MSDPRSLLERESRRFTQPDGSFERLVLRRDRKRRNQRIAAGVAGIAMFVAAVLVVTTVGSFDRTQPGASGGAGTGPTATDVTDPPSEEGEVVAEFAMGYPSASFVFVYADGRVIAAEADSHGVTERRLSPEGVELVKSGAIQAEDLLDPPFEVPAGGWAVRDARPYVPSHQAVCFYQEPNRETNSGYEYPAQVVGFFPAPARAILRGELTHGEVGGSIDPASPECSKVTTDEARALDEILSDVTVVDSAGDEISWEVSMTLPHGVRVYCLGCG